MRYVQGDGLTDERRAFREKLREELDAWLVFEDKAGFSMTPLTARWMDREVQAAEGQAPCNHVGYMTKRRDLAIAVTTTPTAVPLGTLPASVIHTASHPLLGSWRRAVCLSVRTR
ncbi:hypothetical protein [Streptomyces sp. NPDC046727]|uniref:hypothetical protein n=1 Tax=Streptomyces sp. NPDC046727 TaxID=3155373 RepID=UPI0033DCE820